MDEAQIQAGPEIKRITSTINRVREGTAIITGTEIYRAIATGEVPGTGESVAQVALGDEVDMYPVGY